MGDKEFSTSSSKTAATASVGTCTVTSSICICFGVGTVTIIDNNIRSNWCSSDAGEELNNQDHPFFGDCSSKPMLALPPHNMLCPTLKSPKTEPNGGLLDAGPLDYYSRNSIIVALGCYPSGN